MAFLKTVNEEILFSGIWSKGGYGNENKGADESWVLSKIVI